MGIPPECFAPHSFCIRAVSAAAAVGMSGSEIRNIGRWGAEAFQGNIRSYSAYHKGEGAQTPFSQW